MDDAAPPVATGGSRPRVEGAREREIYLAALDVLGEQGYDRLTLDTVAARARASKATLYRRWSSKAELVAEALASLKAEHTPLLPDTGSLRGDLLALTNGSESGLLDPDRAHLICSVATAMTRDDELSAAIQSGFLAVSRAWLVALFEQARDRGQIRADVDLELISSVLPAIMLFRMITGDSTLSTTDLVARVIDDIVLPAVALVPAARVDSG